MPAKKQTILMVLLALVSTGPVRAEGPAGRAERSKVVILTGANNHNWKSTTPALK